MSFSVGDDVEFVSNYKSESRNMIGTIVEIIEDNFGIYQYVVFVHDDNERVCLLAAFNKIWHTNKLQSYGA